MSTDGEESSEDGASAVDEEKTESVAMCTRCMGVTCFWEQLRDVFIAKRHDDVGSAESSVGNNLLLKRAYRTYTQERHG